MKQEAALTVTAWAAGAMALIGAATLNTVLMATAGIIAAVAALLWGLLMYVQDKETR